MFCLQRPLVLPLVAPSSLVAWSSTAEEKELSRTYITYFRRILKSTTDLPNWSHSLSNRSRNQSIGWDNVASVQMDLSLGRRGSPLLGFGSVLPHELAADILQVLPASVAQM